MPTTPEKTGKVYKYMELEFYAINGFVRVHDNRDGSIKDLNPADFLEHAEALAAAIPRMDSYQEKVTAAKMANNVEACCDEAIAMGSPFDERANAYMRRHKTYRKPYVQVPGMGGWVRDGSGLIVPSSSLRQT